MEDTRRAARHEANHWVYVSGIGNIYKIAGKGTLLRRYAADLINCEDPFRKFAKGSKELKEGDSLLERHPDLARDMATSDKKF
jgi:hypothetical protein